MSLQDWTALPNLHPALVHFPIVLVAVGLMGDLLLVLRVRSLPLDRHVALLWLAATASAGVTYWAGEEAAESLVLPAAAEAPLALHEDWALAALVAIAGVAVLRLAISWRDREEPEPGSRGGRLVALGVAIVVQGIVLRTADLGGALVYHHGVAVRSVTEVASESVSPTESPAPGVPSPAGPSPPAPNAAADDRVRLADGSVLWAPRPGDASVLGRVLERRGEGRVEVLPADASGGLALRIDGPIWLVLPDALQDESVEVRWQTDAFDGALGLVGRIGEDGRAARLEVRRAGEKAEVSLAVADPGGSAELLGREAATLPAGVWSLALSLAGRHWRGLVDGVSVVHGHAVLPRPGRAGLAFRGRGVVRIDQVRIHPAREDA